MEDHPRIVVAVLEAVARELRYDLPVCAAEVGLRPRGVAVAVTVIGGAAERLCTQAGEITRRVMDRVGVRK